MRASGILMHISSLYGDYSIGSFGKNALDFIDFIKDKVLLIFPKEDFFSNDEQKSLQDLFPYAKTEYIKNGHFGTVLEYEKYIGLMKEFI